MLWSALGGGVFQNQACWRFNSGGLSSTQAQPVLILIPQTFCLYEGGVGSGGSNDGKERIRDACLSQYIHSH